MRPMTKMPSAIEPYDSRPRSASNPTQFENEKSGMTEKPTNTEIRLSDSSAASIGAAELRPDTKKSPRISQALSGSPL